MDKIHSRFDRAIKNGPGFTKGWHFIYAGYANGGDSDIVLMHSKTKKIKKLSKKERLFLKISNLNFEIKRDGLDQWTARIYDDDDKCIQDPNKYFNLTFMTWQK